VDPDGPEHIERTLIHHKHTAGASLGEGPTADETRAPDRGFVCAEPSADDLRQRQLCEAEDVGLPGTHKRQQVQVQVELGSEQQPA
jgi:hypothetical protein